MLDLDQLALLGSARGGSGRKAGKNINFLVTRELGAADLPALLERRSVGSVTPPLAQIRESHHHLARLLAEGRRAVEVAAITGFSQSRIALLKNDPSFKELLAYYAEQNKAAYASIHERLARVGTTALEVVEERLLDNPDQFSHKELLNVVEVTMDRSVAPPKTRDQGMAPGGGAAPVQVSINFVGHQPPAELPLIELQGEE